jgi:hypothetical protein
MRICNKCNVEKSLDDFHKNKNLKEGRCYTCKPCALSLVKAWSLTEKGKEKAKAAKKKYSSTEHGKAKNKAYNKLPKTREKARKRRSFVRSLPGGKFPEFKNRIFREYGLSVRDWAKMYLEQNSRCAACGDFLLFDKSTHIDHDHVSGKVRGLLCHVCNLAIGLAKDSPEKLRGMADYLERHKK